MKIAFITGITGMDGSHLADLLVEKDYKVYGLIRRHSTPSLWRIRHILNRIELVSGDITRSESLRKNLALIKPDEVYNLAAQSFVKFSFDEPVYTADVTGLGALRLIEAVRQSSKDSKVFHASSSEMFGKVKETPQKETTPFYPRSPYGCAKCFAHRVMVNYREAYNLFICCGISFNHESERRGEEFVSRKISKTVAQMKRELLTHGEIKSQLVLGNIDAKRDWGYAPDYVKGFWKTLQQDIADDYVFATGTANSVENFIEVAFRCIGIVDWEKHTRISDKFKRPAEVDCLKGDATKAGEELNWFPKMGFAEMVKKMVEAD